MVMNKICSRFFHPTNISDCLCPRHQRQTPFYLLPIMSAWHPTNWSGRFLRKKLASARFEQMTCDWNELTATAQSHASFLGGTSLRASLGQTQRHFGCQPASMVRTNEDDWCAGPSCDTSTWASSWSSAWYVSQWRRGSQPWNICWQLEFLSPKRWR